MKIVTLEAGDVCQYENCEEPATAIACGMEAPIGLVGHHEPGVYCDKHAKDVMDEGMFNSYAFCPNCNCAFGAG